jgi:hypothetical protein
MNFLVSQQGILTHCAVAAIIADKFSAFFMHLKQIKDTLLRYKKKIRKIRRFISPTFKCAFMSQLCLDLYGQ